MSDDIDRVQDAQAIHIAAAISRISAAIPAGAPGECDDCGEYMPRIVDGRCAYCRDGRRPPLDRYSDLPPVSVADDRLDAPVVVQAATAPAPGVPIPQEEEAMSTPVPSRKVAIMGTALAAVEKLVAERDCSYQQATNSLIELAGARSVSGGEAPAVAATPHAIVDLSTIGDDDLFEEITARLKSASDATARAETAEAALAAIRQTVLGVGQQL